MCVTDLLGVYYDGVFLYLHVMANFVYKWAVYCFDVYGTFLMSAILILIMSCIFNILRFKQRFCVRIISTYCYNPNCFFCSLIIISH